VPWNSRISAVKAMSVADNFLQKQQKQRVGRLAKLRCGDPAGRPSGSRAPISPAIGIFPIPAVGFARPERRRQSVAAGTASVGVSLCLTKRPIKGFGRLRHALFLQDGFLFQRLGVGRYASWGN